MRTSRLLIVFLPICCIVLVAASRTGAASAWSYGNAMTFPRGARSLGMGGVGVADLSNPVNGYYNPAALAWTSGIFLEASYNSWLDLYTYTDTRISAGKSTEKILFGGLLGFSTQSLDLDCVYSAWSPECKPVDNPNYYVTGAAAVAWRSGNREIGIGAAIKHLENTNTADYHTTVVDLGIIVTYLIETGEGYRIRPSIGISFRNIGKDIKIQRETIKEPLMLKQPQENRYGFGLDFSTPPVASATKKLGRAVPALKVVVDYDLIRGAGSSYAEGWGLGMEASLFETLFIRTGNSRDSIENSQYMNFGIGLGWQDPDNGFLLRLDFTRMDNPLADSFYRESKHDHVLGLVYGKEF